MKDATMNCFNLKNPCIFSHVHDLREHEAEYLKQIRHYTSSKAVWACVTTAIKARVIAALHICSHHRELDSLLPHCEITDIEKALVILDRPRVARQLRKKIASIERSMVKTSPKEIVKCSVADAVAQKTKRYKIDVLRSSLKRIDALIQKGDGDHRGQKCLDLHSHPIINECVANSSVSGSMARRIQRWAKSIKPDFLEYVMLEMPTTAWKNVADLVHFRPSDFQVPYFLHDVYGQAIPEDSFVFNMRRLIKASPSNVADEFNAVAKRYPQVYDAFAFLRRHPSIIQSEPIVLQFARNIPLDTFLWYFDEFHAVAKDCQIIIEERLSEALKNETAIHNGKSFTYGKLLACIVSFRKKNISQSLCARLEEVAAQRLAHLQQYWKAQHDSNEIIAVFGDASSSMQVAVEAATIFASMVSACLDGELSFFGTGLIKSPHEKPKTVKDTLDVCDAIRACGMTNFAAALWPYYDEKRSVDTIVIVTDEWENGRTMGDDFSEMLAKYKKKVNPDVVLIVVRVGAGAEDFQKNLERNGIEYSVIVVDDQRPDLAKFDALLGQIVALSSKSEKSAVVVEKDDASTSMEVVDQEDSTSTYLDGAKLLFGSSSSDSSANSESNGGDDFVVI